MVTTAGSTVIPSSVIWREQYLTHVRSPQWHNMRQDMIRLRGGRCERCSYQHGLELHHRNYERVGRELTSDLELLCHACHKEADRERAAEGQRKTREAIYNTGLNTYATKKYGPRWAEYLDPEQVAEEFSAWLRRKQEKDDD